MNRLILPVAKKNGRIILTERTLTWSSSLSFERGANWHACVERTFTNDIHSASMGSQHRFVFSIYVPSP